MTDYSKFSPRQIAQLIQDVADTALGEDVCDVQVGLDPSSYLVALWTLPEHVNGVVFVWPILVEGLTANGIYADVTGFSGLASLKDDAALAITTLTIAFNRPNGLS